jgi:hypothetical protein
MGTLFHLADCHEHVGRSATAWAEYLDVAAQAKAAGQAARERLARERAAALARSLSHLTIDVKGTRLPGLRVTRDGSEIGSGQWGSSIPVDPGDHEIAASAPDRQTWSATVHVDAKGGAATVSVPELAAPRPTPAPPPARTAIEPAAPPMAPPPPNERAALHPRRVAALAAGGAAVLAFAGGGALTALALSKNADSNAQGRCVGDLCTSEGTQLRYDARTAGDVATAAFIAGGVLAAAGLGLWFTAPSHESGHVIAVAPWPGGVTVVWGL